MSTRIAISAYKMSRKFIKNLFYRDLRGQRWGTEVTAAKPDADGEVRVMMLFTHRSEASTFSAACSSFSRPGR
jgi:hypothetical protein